jgi:hypothetical protein
VIGVLEPVRDVAERVGEAVAGCVEAQHPCVAAPAVLERVLHPARGRDQRAWANGLARSPERHFQFSLDQDEGVDSVLSMVESQIRTRSVEMPFDDAQVG